MTETTSANPELLADQVSRRLAQPLEAGLCAGRHHGPDLDLHLAALRAAGLELTECRRTLRLPRRYRCRYDH